jgi:hypothetical protein
MTRQYYYILLLVWDSLAVAMVTATIRIGLALAVLV